MTENIPATDAEITTAAAFLINIGNYEVEPEADEFIFEQLPAELMGDDDAKGIEESNS
jgi:hypothetical protein